MDILAFIAGLKLPWLLGIAALAAVRDTRRPADAPGEVAWIVGAGYLVGAFLLTLWMRVLSLAEIPFGRAAIAAPLLFATAALAVRRMAQAWRRVDRRRHARRTARAHSAAGRRAARPGSRGSCSSPGSRFATCCSPSK